MARAQPRPGRAIVVGAGIGGMTAALALQRNGWDVQILERAPELGEVGAGVAIAPNAVKALRELELESALDAVACELDGLESLTRDGRRLTGVDADLLRERFGAGLYNIHRAELHGLLHDALGGGAVATGCVAIAADPEGAVTVERSGRRFELDADLIVAADGVNSRLRQSMFRDYPGPVHAGYAVWRGLVPAEAAASLRVPDRLCETWGTGARFGHAPIGDGRAYWYALVNGELDVEAATLAARFDGWHRPIRELIEATPAQTLIHGQVHYLPHRLPSFTLGRVALLGDAAHAVTPDIGQGACLAIEDALVMAAELTRADVPDALRAYDAVRRPRTQRLARQSGRIGRMLMNPNPIIAGVRDAVVRIVPATMALKSVGDIYEWSPERIGG